MMGPVRRSVMEKRFKITQNFHIFEVFYTIRLAVARISLFSRRIVLYNITNAIERVKLQARIAGSNDLEDSHAINKPRS